MFVRCTDTAGTHVYAVWPTVEPDGSVQYTSEYYHAVILKPDKYVKVPNTSKLVQSVDGGDPVQVPHNVTFSNVVVPGMVQPVQVNKNMVRLSLTKLKAIAERVDTARQRSQLVHQAASPVTSTPVLPSKTPVHATAAARTPTTADLKPLLSAVATGATPAQHSTLKRKSTSSPGAAPADTPASKRQAVTPAVQDAAPQPAPSKPVASNKQTITPLPPAAQPVVKKPKPEVVQKYEKRTTWRVELPKAECKVSDELNKLMHAELVDADESQHTYISVSGKRVPWSEHPPVNTEQLKIHPFVFVYT